MQSGLYVALSAQVALQNRLETIAQNVANRTSAGYRGSKMKFEAVLSKMSDPLVSFVSSGSGVIRRSSGEHVKTGNPLDVAVRGDGWLSVTTSSGQAYTRDGRMRMTSAGDLVSMTGGRILDAGGGPIRINPTAGRTRDSRGRNDHSEWKEGCRLGPVHTPKQRPALAYRGQCFHIECPGNPNCELRRERRRARLRRAIEREPHDGDDPTDLRPESLRWCHLDAASHRKQP